MLLDVLGACLVVIAFAVLVHVTGLVTRTRAVVDVANGALRTVRDASLSDDQKEAAMQRSTVRMLGLLGVLVAGTAFALAAPIALVWVLDALELLSLDGVLAMLVRWEFLLGGTVLGIAVYMASVRWLKTPS